MIDDTTGNTLVSASTLDKELRGACGAAQQDGAGQSGGQGRRRAGHWPKGIKEVVFDRGGYPYHGRVKALADGSREGGLDF